MARQVESGRVAFWRELIERRRSSGLSVARFCGEAGVSTASFYLWQRKLRGSAVPVRKAQPVRRPASQLVPVRIVPDTPIRGVSSATARTGDVLEVDLPGEIHLRIPSGCDVSTVQVVLNVLLRGGSREVGSC